tara:strand:+ start:57 stop:473 length:417 start_codon:yes stop_codon:yes gene_type:complete
MATFTSDMVSGNQSFKPFPSGAVGVRKGTISLTAAPNVGDIYQVVDVFAGETVHDVKIKCSDLDSNGSPALVFGVGDGDDTDYYIAASAAGQTGVADEQDADVCPKVYSADDTIDVICEVAPATDVATGTIEVWVYIS